MSNTTLTADIVAKEAVAILDNELVMAKKVYRGHEEEFAKKVNGYEVGDTISVRRPTDFTVRDGPVMSVQDVVEGKIPLTVDKRKGIDFKFTSQELTLKIGELSERVIKPAMIQLANQIDRDLMALYSSVPNWVGTPGELVNSFSDFSKAPERLDEYAIPQSERSSVLSPADHWAMVGSQTGLYNDTVNKPAYREGDTGKVGGVELYMSQNVPTHTTGADLTGTVGASVTAATISYATVKDSMQQTITTASLALNPGDVFTIADVWAVNPVTKARLPFNKQFTVVSHNANTLVLYPAMIWDGAFQNIAVTSGTTDLNGKAITAMGTAGVGYRQNMVFHKNAFALVTVPLVSPPGASEVARRTYKGTSVRVIPVYDGVNDESAWRLDVLYGTKAIDPRLAVRISGST